MIKVNMRIGVLKKMAIGSILFSMITTYSTKPIANNNLEKIISNTKKQYYVNSFYNNTHNYWDNIFCVRSVAVYEKKGKEIKLPLGHATLTLFNTEKNTSYFFTAYHIKDAEKIDYIKRKLEGKFIKKNVGYEFKKYAYFIVDNRFDTYEKDDLCLDVVEGVKNLDLLILKYEGSGGKYEENLKKHKKIILGDSSKLNVGDLVVAIGYHYSTYKILSRGIISNTRKGVKPFEDDLLIDINLNPGASGCPVFAIKDGKFEMIGLFHQYFSPDSIPRGIHFAVPINNIKEILRKYGGKK